MSADDFEVVDAEAGAPGPGQVLIAVRRLGLNAGLASRLGGRGTAYGPGVGVGDVPGSDAVVDVVESRDDRFRAGDRAVAKTPWRTFAVIDADELRPIDDSDDEMQNQLTILGHVGFTAWTGVVHVGEVGPDDVVYVSAAAGGVGSCVVQFAKARGATVIGVCGSPEKVALLTEQLGADRAIDRHDGAAVDLLRASAPDGIDLYYDNVGGEQLEAALEVLNTGGRAVICGAVSGGSLPGNFTEVIHKELTLRGFTVTAHLALRERFEADVRRWMREGKVHSVDTVFEGIERVPEAFASLLAGISSGRVVVSMAPAPRKAHPVG